MKKINFDEEFNLDGNIYMFSKKESGVTLKRIREAYKHSATKLIKGFTPPTLDEVKAFFKSKGYSDIGATKAWEHYELGNPPWHDTQGTPVRAWKQKMNTNWLRDEFKVVTTGNKMVR